MDLLFLQYSNIVDGEICFVRSQNILRAISNVAKRYVQSITPEMWDIIQKWGNPRYKPANLYF